MCRFLLCIMLVTGGPAAQAAADPSAEARKPEGANTLQGGASQPAPPMARLATNTAVFARNRSRFLQARHTLETEQQRLEDALASSRAELSSLSQERALLVAALEDAQGDRLGGLRALNRSIEDKAISLLSPLNGMLATFVDDIDDTAGRSDAALSSAYVTVALPLVIVLTLVAARRRFPEIYRRWQAYVHPLALALMLLFPLSSFAQNPDTDAGSEHTDLRTLIDHAAGVVTGSAFPGRAHRYPDYPATGSRPGVSGSPASAPTGDLAQLVNEADGHLEDGRVTAASRLLSDAIEGVAGRDARLVSSGTVATVDALVYLSEASLARKLYVIAESALIEALKPLTVAERRALQLHVPKGAAPLSRLPHPAHVAAPLYLGLLHEKQGRRDAARSRFEQEAKLALEQFVNGTGREVTDLHNSLSLLGGALAPKEDAALLLEIDRLLRVIEDRELEGIANSGEPIVSPLREELDAKKRQKEMLSADIAKLQDAIDAATPGAVGLALGTLLLALRAIGVLLVVGVLCFAAVSVAFDHAVHQSRQRLHAFWWTLAESVGWIWVFSLTSAPLGAAVVAAARLFRVNNVSDAVTTETGDRAIPPSPTEKHLEEEAQRHDHEWDNVIRMLRDSKRSEAG